VNGERGNRKGKGKEKKGKTGKKSNEEINKRLETRD
jgi:hypothetical protein